ncbi:hypothetical protein N1851_014100 [Merluccius polli]|uniref:Reverse transcriptase n=1 Tax=Merluccius polli TaxID=89951 RepID=A0AA47MU59_MERPO|nr:hypothetical protein N1851_014100 [Merluccius polli]
MRKEFVNLILTKRWNDTDITGNVECPRLKVDISLTSLEIHLFKPPFHKHSTVPQVIDEPLLELSLGRATTHLKFVVARNRNKRRGLPSVNISSHSLKTRDQVRNLGVLIDSDLTFSSHIKSITKTAFYQLKNISRVKGFMSQTDQEKLIHAFISSRLDYCNGLLTGLPQQSIKQLQLIQNAAARVLTRTKRSEHITPVLKSLHWLPISYRIDFKVLLLVYKSLNGLGPEYMNDILVEYKPSRALRSTDSGQIVEPRVQTKHAITSKLSVSKHLESLSLKTRDQVRNLGVLIDSDLIFSSHIKSITKTAFYQLKNISRVKGFMSQTDQEKLIHAFISSRLDYCNGLLTGLPQKSIKQLQLIQNAAARVLTRTKRLEHITPVLKSLHWLTVSYRIDFKVLLYKSLNGLGPEYMNDILVEYKPSRALRSTDSGQIVEPRVQTKHGEAAFSCYAAQNWNKLPAETISPNCEHL